jgi:hypothetical protein
MKGQNKIINEMLIFALGISITAAIVINFQMVQKSADETTTYSNFHNVANTIINGMTVVMNDRGKVVVKIPDQINGEVYRIKVSSDELIISNADNPSINIKKSLFNISSDYIVQGDVLSSAQYVDIVFEMSESGLTKFIRVRRSERYA